MTRIKVIHNGDMRRLALPDDADFTALQDLLRAAYNLHELHIRYKDDEGDLVTMTSNVELSEARDTMDGAVLRLDISSPQAPPHPHTPPPHATPHAHPPHAHAPSHAHPHAPPLALSGDADMFLDSAVEAITWLSFFWLIYRGFSTVLVLVAFGVAHRRFQIRPRLKRHLAAFLRNRRGFLEPHLAPHPPHLPPPHSF